MGWVAAERRAWRTVEAGVKKVEGLPAVEICEYYEPETRRGDVKSISRISFCAKGFGGRASIENRAAYLGEGP